MNTTGKLIIVLFGSVLLATPLILLAMRVSEEKVTSEEVLTVNRLIATEMNSSINSSIENDSSVGSKTPSLAPSQNGPSRSEPELSSVRTSKILPVGATSADIVFAFEDADQDITDILFETTEFFYKTGKTDVYNSDFRALGDIPTLACDDGEHGECTVTATFVGTLGWRDVFSGRLQLRDSKGQTSKAVPFNITIGTQN
ncbi:MAG: hypothetical protein HYV34_00085 [Candidatus Kerfeldbacteria bacterium]|nr:hypothetical protein [Candidatus Kerfeldbacteria bacterium]